MRDNSFEQRCAIRFCFKLGHSATETFQKLQQAFGDSVLSRAQIFRWFKAFSEGRETIEDEPPSGRPSTAKIDENVIKVRDLVRFDRRLTVRMTGEQLGLTHTTVYQILTNDLEMRKICAKMNVSLLVTSLGFSSTTRKQSVRVKNGTHQLHQGKNRISKSKIKSMLICFFDSHGIVHKEFVPQGQTVNQHFYKEVLEKLRKRVIRVRPNIKNTWVLHHDNAPCHTAISISQFLATKNIPVAPQPPYSPNLSPCDFFLFPRIKIHLKGRHFGTLENIQSSVTDELKAIPVTEFQNCYKQWKHRLQCCVDSQGNYFEGDNVKKSF
ncbi:histone-lysine N-methyltransferase SETMAR-like [Rhopalosiphum maidis]|uniref:histone-lysine N-methyltransferase SETMAR-like n=1 Tax=Rhopalosiphum maidis TaxID=43146 RepID=UPI000F00E076|nr:histone-lysine N-methyltransferase SETMAR-like [Rhopalosiphum maidis]